MSAPETKHPGFLVWNPSGPHMPRYRHNSLEEARGEAKRMANLHPGQPFYLLAPIGVAIAERPSAAFHVIDQQQREGEDEVPF